MRGQAGDLKNIAARKQRIMDVGFRLFCERGIESVSMKTIAEQSGVPWTSMYRYFATKLDLVITISTWTWNEYITSYVDRSDRERIQQMTAAEYLKWLLDSFLDLYRNHGDILRFNYSFNSYLRNEQATAEQKQSYLRRVDSLHAAFHQLYEKGMADGTLNRSIAEEEMFSSSFHIMLAAVTRYATGLMYLPPGPETDPERELERLEAMMLREFTVSP